MEKNIILCGFMGCGKTTIGRHLSFILSKNFVDIDEYIEKKQGKSINDIFDSFGEPYFRDLEYEAIKKIADKNVRIIATGGGALVNKKIIQYLKSSNSVIVFLNVSLKSIKERLKDDNCRPLIKGNPKKIDKLYYERLDIYKDVSDITVDADRSIDETCKEIIKLVENL